MCIPSIELTLACSKSQVKQTKCSLISRIVAVGLGAITLLIGVLVLCGIPGLSTLGTTGGSLFSALGALMLLTGASLRCIRKNDKPISKDSASISQPKSQDNSQRKSTDSIVHDDHVKSKVTNSSLDQVNDRNKKEPIDFAKITPANYEQYLDVSQVFSWENIEDGNFIITKRVHAKDYTSSYTPYEYKKGDVYLVGHVTFITEKGEETSYDHGGLEICNGEFIHYPQKAAPPVRFSNLKDFFDYLFQGNFYQGECTKNRDFFSLKTIDGSKVRYYNPYKKK